MQAHTSELRFGAGRFVVKDTLGAGGAGTVYRVFDHQLGRDVALKVLRTASGRDLFRFKREFRSLADIVHPNLVALHELHASGDEWFFTMELIEGVSFIDWVRPPLDGSRKRKTRQQTIEAVLDEQRLRSCLVQLADALVALHKCGKLHRDLKPSNVIVTDAGRAVLLDFGLVSGLQESNPEHLAVGTPAYMSPEQAADAPLGPPSDWYALGAMLYEALTGRRPFEGTPQEVMRRKQLELPAAPSQIARDVPGGLEGIALNLLHPNQNKRPEGLVVLSALGAAPSVATRDIARALVRNAFVGRKRELDFMRRALSESRRRGNCVFVRGPSGIGKSTLLRQTFALVGEQAYILEGRCFERESVPFKMLDGVVDSLATLLVAMVNAEIEALIPRETSSLLRLFPVLRRVERFAEVSMQQAAPPDPQELRLRGFIGLRHLLSKIAKLRPLFIFIDDVHWGDHDSAAFLCDLIHRPDANMSIVLAHRPEDYLGIVHALRRAPTGVTRHADIRDLDVPPMDYQESQELVAAIAPNDWNGEAIIPAAAGNPLVLSELARADHPANATSVESLVSSRAARLSEEGQALLVVTSVAGRPLPVEVAASAAAILDGHEVASHLAAERLAVLRRVGGQMVLQPAHDYVRLAVVNALSTDVKAAWHEALARALENVPGVVDSQAVVEHWLAAGHPANAALHAIPAAAVAEEALAFRRAADMYQIALTFGTWDAVGQRDLLRRQANALAAAGQLDEAAAAFGHSASLIGDAEAIDLERLRVEQLLRRGRTEEGIASAERLLEQVGVKIQLAGKRPLGKLATQWVAQRIRGTDFVERNIADIQPDDLRKVDVLYSISSGLGFCDPVLGRMVQGEFLKQCLAIGEPYRVCLALAQELVYTAKIGPKSWPFVEQNAQKLKALGARIAHPHIIGIIDATIGLSAHLCGRWQDARLYMEAGLSTLRNHTIGLRWEVDMVETYWLSTLMHLGQWREFSRLVPQLVRDSVERGDLIAQFWLRAGRCNLAYLIANKPHEAEIELAAAQAMLGNNHATIHHVHCLLAAANIDLYRGDIINAKAKMDEAWPILERMFVLRVQTLRVDLESCKARIHLRINHPAERRLAKQLADSLAKESCEWGVAIGNVLQAAIADLSGDRTGAIALLAKAEQSFSNLDMRAWKYIARVRRCQLTGGAAEIAQLEAAKDILAEIGAVNIESILDLFAPFPSLEE